MVKEECSCMDVIKHQNKRGKRIKRNIGVVIYEDELMRNEKR